jgi:hypothetical protein
MRLLAIRPHGRFVTSMRVYSDGMDERLYSKRHGRGGKGVFEKGEYLIGIRFTLTIKDTTGLFQCIISSGRLSVS